MPFLVAATTFAVICRMSTMDLAVSQQCDPPLEYPAAVQSLERQAQEPDPVGMSRPFLVLSLPTFDAVHGKLIQPGTVMCTSCQGIAQELQSYCDSADTPNDDFKLGVCAEAKRP